MQVFGTKVCSLNKGIYKTVNIVYILRIIVVVTVHTINTAGGGAV